MASALVWEVGPNVPGPAAVGPSAPPRAARHPSRARDLGFALPAAAVYLLGAGLLWRFDRRLLWIAGAVLQVLIIAMYLAVASQRNPTFEIWGITIRILQFGLLAGLTYLSIRSARPLQHE